MSNVSQVRAQFISAGTATSATALATEQDPADGYSFNFNRSCYQLLQDLQLVGVQFKELL